MHARDRKRHGGFNIGKQLIQSSGRSREGGICYPRRRVPAIIHHGLGGGGGGPRGRFTDRRSVSSRARAAVPMSLPGFSRRSRFRRCRRCRHRWMAAFSFSPIAHPPGGATTVHHLLMNARLSNRGSCGDGMKIMWRWSEVISGWAAPRVSDSTGPSAATSSGSNETPADLR
jgi:hypothetical protein